MGKIIHKTKIFDNVYPKGMTAKQIEHELNDYKKVLQYVPVVYDYITFGKITNVLTFPEVVKTVFEDCFGEMMEEFFEKESEFYEKKIEELKNELKKYE